jgi:hypothetical protein
MFCFGIRALNDFTAEKLSVRKIESAEYLNMIKAIQCLVETFSST